MKRIAFRIILPLFSIVLLSTFLIPVRTVSILKNPITNSMSKFINSQSEIFINQSQIWYGNFIVNETDTVIIENCNFTVQAGEIYVYGSLIVENSSIAIHRNVYFKNLWVYGNLTLSKSTLVGHILIYSKQNSITEVKSSSVRWVVYYNATVHIYNSSFRQVVGNYGRVTIENSEGMYGGVSLQPSTYLYIMNSNITEFFDIYINRRLPDSLSVLQVPSMYIEMLELSDVGIQLNVTVSSSFVNKWRICVHNDNPGEIVDFTLVNSTVELMAPYIFNMPVESYNLTLKTGTAQYRNVYVDNNFNITLWNSTINNWSFGVKYGTFQFWNSNFSSMIWHNSSVSIFNSTMTYLATRSFQGNLTVSNVTTDVLMLGIECGSMDFVLNEGYQNFINFHNEEQGFNITITESRVNHWGIETYGNSTVNIYNSTITGLEPEPPFAGLYIIENSSVYIYNSNVTGAYCALHYASSWYPSLTIVNSTMEMLYAYYNSNVTAINSTIGTIISDPPSIELVNSTVLSKIYLPFAISSDILLPSILDDCRAPLPQNIKRISKYVHVASTYDDLIKAQIRIYYDENELNGSGLNETDLVMYHLEEHSSEWRLCSTQGVNTTENYVWANVTHFSTFVICIPQMLRDIAITNITFSKQNPAVNETVHIYVTVENRGNLTETFDVSVNYTLLVDPLIGTQTITLEPGETITLTFEWTPTASGRYEIKAYTSEIPNDINPADNTKTTYIYVTSGSSGGRGGGGRWALLL